MAPVNANNIHLGLKGNLASDSGSLKLPPPPSFNTLKRKDKMHCFTSSTSVTHFAVLRHSAPRISVNFFLSKSNLLHRPLFTKLFTPVEPSLFPTTKHIISPATKMYYHQREKGLFLGCRSSRIGEVLVPIMVRWVKILFWFLDLYWFQKGAIEVD